MKDAVLVALLVAIVLSTWACGRRREETPPMHEVGAPIAATHQANTSESTEGSQALEGPADPGMTEQLRVFIHERGRFPTDFGEFSRARLDSVPRVPQGMKWAIDPVTQEVKLVKQ